MLHKVGLETEVEQGSRVELEKLVTREELEIKVEPAEQEQEAWAYSQSRFP